MEKKLDNKWIEIIKKNNLKNTFSDIGIRSIKLPLGKKFIEKDSLPSGVLFLTSGRMREISFDYNNEPNFAIMLAGRSYSSSDNLYDNILLTQIPEYSNYSILLSVLILIRLTSSRAYIKAYK